MTGDIERASINIAVAIGHAIAAWAYYTQRCNKRPPQVDYREGALPFIKGWS